MNRKRRRTIIRNREDEEKEREGGVGGVSDGASYWRKSINTSHFCFFVRRLALYTFSSHEYCCWSVLKTICYPSTLPDGTQLFFTLLKNVSSECVSSVMYSPEKIYIKSATLSYVMSVASIRCYEEFLIDVSCCILIVVKKINTVLGDVV